MKNKNVLIIDHLTEVSSIKVLLSGRWIRLKSNFLTSISKQFVWTESCKSPATAPEVVRKEVGCTKVDPALLDG